MKRRIFLMTLVLLLVGTLMLGLAACNGGNKGNGGNEACEHSGVTLTETKAATCLEAGQRSGTCPDCGEPVTETIPALGHNRVDGWCDACSTGLYTNLIASAGEQSFGFYLTGLKFTMYAEESYEWYESGVRLSDVQMTQVGSTFLTLDFNDEGLPVLVGQVLLKADVKEGDKAEPSEYASTASLMLEFDGKTAYLWRKEANEEDGESYEQGLYSMMVADEESTVLLSEFWEVLTQISEKLSPVLESLELTSPKLANELLAKTALRLFTEVATDDGYVYTLSSANVREIVDELLSEKTVGEFIADLLGADFVADLLATVKEYAVLTPAECYDKLRAKGVAPEDIFPLIDELIRIVEEEEIDSEEILTADAILNVKLFDLMMGNFEGEATSNADIVTAIDTLYNEQIKPMLDSTVAELADLDEAMVKAIADQVEVYIAAILDNVTVSFTTDKEGVLTGASVSVDLKELDLVALGLDTDADTIVSTIAELTATLTVKVNPAAPEDDTATKVVGDFIKPLVDALAKTELSDEDEYSQQTVQVVDGEIILTSFVEDGVEWIFVPELGEIELYYSRDYQAKATVSVENLNEFTATYGSDVDVYRVYLYFDVESVTRDNIVIDSGYSYGTDEELDAAQAGAYLEELKSQFDGQQIRLLVYYNVKTGEITTEYPEDMVLY